MNDMGVPSGPGYTASRMEDAREGTVIAMHGPLVRVRCGDETIVAAARRRLEWEGGRPAAARLVVGDHVLLDASVEEPVIQAVRQRRTALLRKAPSSARPQVLAANVDQALIVFAARRPTPNRRLLDRFLVACHHAGIEAVITMNKVDQGLDLVRAWLGRYEMLGIPTLVVSARTGRGLGTVKRRLAGRTTLFCGPSGAGKSSLLNAVQPGLRLRVGSISEATGKGRHTTTMAELLPLSLGGFVVDTPGLKEFGLWNLTRLELEGAFPEIRDLAAECRFANCTHEHEPDCAVQRAVEDGALDDERYRSYVTLLEEIVV
jgi:ribosome biogenesis GTPase